MKSFLTTTLTTGLALGQTVLAMTPGFSHHHMSKRQIDHAAILASKSSHIKAYDIPVPVDHFHNDTRYEPHSDAQFHLRYWLDTSNYRPGGPVIVLHSGEFDSTGRLPYLEHGIVPVLTKAFGGVGLVMEHRYYGESFPMETTSTENLRFLSVEQALADTAYFARNITFPGLEHVNLTAGAAPWIIYGGSYAATVAALSRKIYPDVFWGAISSSGVPQSIDDYWQYLEAARHFAPKGCVEATQKLTHIVDNILFGGDKDQIDKLKELFHLQGLENDEFGETIASLGGIMSLQSTMWDIEEDSPHLGYYCGAVTSDAPLFASMRHRIARARHFVSIGGYEHQVNELAMPLLNWAGIVRFNLRDALKGPCKGKSARECFSNRFLNTDETSLDWERSWKYQTCIENGFFITGTGVPKDQLPLISRAVTRDYAAWHCPNLFNITDLPNVDNINKFGGFDFSHSRLAHLDGAQDPWRAAGVHAIGQKDRKSTVSEPFILVDYGVHHWDEFGLASGTEEQDLPPRQVVDAQQAMVGFVGEWLKEWDAENGGKHTKGTTSDTAEADEL